MTVKPNAQLAVDEANMTRVAINIAKFALELNPLWLWEAESAKENSLIADIRRAK